MKAIAEGAEVVEVEDDSPSPPDARNAKVSGSIDKQHGVRDVSSPAAKSVKPLNGVSVPPSC